MKIEINDNFEIVATLYKSDFQQIKEFNIKNLKIDRLFIPFQYKDIFANTLAFSLLKKNILNSDNTIYSYLYYYDDLSWVKSFTELNQVISNYIINRDIVVTITESVILDKLKLWNTGVESNYITYLSSILNKYLELCNQLSKAITKKEFQNKKQILDYVDLCKSMIDIKESNLVDFINFDLIDEVIISYEANKEDLKWLL